MESKNLLNGTKKMSSLDQSLKEKRGRDEFLKYKPFMLTLVAFIKVVPLNLRISIFNFLRMLQGRLGLALRYILLKSIAKECGDNVSIHPGVYLYSPENLVLGKNVSIHPMCYIDCTGEIEIGNDVSIAHNTTIMSTEHKYKKVSLPIKDQGLNRYKTIIGSDVWIGAGSRILAGVTISEGCVIGAASVVTKKTLPYSVYVGAPVKKITERKD